MYTAQARATLDAMIHFRKKSTRYAVVVFIGLLAGLVSSRWLDWQVAGLVGWDVAALLLVIFIRLDFSRHNPTETARVARSDDFNHGVMDTIMLVASLVSLAAVAVLLTSQSIDATTKLMHDGLGLLSIVISWATVHTIYSLRYAAMYYRGTEGGVDFGKGRPTFDDFAYLAYTVGMTCQISDTTLQTSEFRSVVLRHAWLSFLFGTAIIATTINLVASTLTQ